MALPGGYLKCFPHKHIRLCVRMFAFGGLAQRAFNECPKLWGIFCACMSLAPYIYVWSKIIYIGVCIYNVCQCESLRCTQFYLQTSDIIILQIEHIRAICSVSTKSSNNPRNNKLPNYTCSQSFIYVSKYLPWVNKFAAYHYASRCQGKLNNNRYKRNISKYRVSLEQVK